MDLNTIENVGEALRSLGIPENDPTIIMKELRAHRDNIERWMAVATQLRPSYLDETAFHAAEIVYKAATTRFELEERLAGNYGVLYQKWGRPHEAIKWFEISLSLNSKYTRSRHNIAHCYELLEDYDAAEENYRLAIKDDPESIQSWNDLASCLWEQGRRDDAISAYRRAIRANPKNIDALFNLAVRFLSIRDFDSARRWIERVIEIAPGDSGAVQIRDYVRRREIPPLAPPSVAARPQGTFFRTAVIPDIEVWPIEQIWKAIDDAAKKTPSMAEGESPVIFLSYRRDSEELAAWIDRLADRLVERGYRVVYDRAFGLKREIVGIPVILEQLLNSTHFVSILTERYRRSVEFAVARDKSATTISRDDSVVLDEWLAALALASKHRLNLVGIWHSGPVVPDPYSWDTVVDARRQDEFQSALAPFPICDTAGQFEEFPEPKSHLEQSHFVTRSAGVSIVSHPLNLQDVFLQRSLAFQAVSKNLGSSRSQT